MNTKINLKNKFMTYVVITVIGLLMSVINPVLAHTDTSTSELISEIKIEQNIDDLGDVDCDQISDEHFEEVGDAVMSLMHPDDEEHELMDNMMGGEGSESLRARHIWMGKQYLGCLSETSTNFRGSMMTGGMMNGYDVFDGDYMMYDGDSHSNLAIWIMSFLMLSVLLVLVVIAVKLVNSSKGTTALESLKIRYAKGEIDEKTYGEMKKELV